jgi:hypothetical protein
MNKEGGKVNNRYVLRNHKHNNRVGKEEENDEEEVAEEEEDNEGEGGRDWQRQRVDETYNKESAEENLDKDGLEMPRDLNLDDKAGVLVALLPSRA